jgi:Ca-activated chloride channel family protein
METSSLTFASPAWFFALFLLPVVAGLYAWAWRRNDALIAKVVAVRLRTQLAGAVSRGRRLFKALVLLVVMALAILALARPQWGYVEREVKQRGRDIIIAVDTSRSMLATDVSPTRLARAKLAAQDLLRLVQGDRVGLIAFAGSAFLQAPLTLDQSAVLTSLDELDTNVIPKGGTNIAAAIRDAQEAFGKGEGQTRALVILTDGEELDADGIAAVKKAAAEGVRIFTVGIGSGEGSLIPLKREDGGTDFVRDSAGKPVQSRLDETRLREIAEAGGGFYEPLSADVARTIFEKGILPMELKETGELTSRQPIERYQWPLGFATALLALWMMLGDRRKVSTAPVRRLAAAAALVLLSAPLASAATGYDAYQAKDYQKALEDFQARLKSSPDSPQLQYDAGAASYKLGDFGKAVDHFTKALLAENRKLREDASYNLGNALVRRGEAAKGKEEKKADWKNAIQHYTEALNLQPKNKRAEENREIVKKMLEDLEKEEQKQDQQNQDQQNQDQKDQQDNKDQQQQQNQQQNNDQKKNDQQKQDQKNQDQQKQNQQKKDQKDQQQDNKDQNQQSQPKDQKDQQNPQDQKKDGNQQGQPDQKKNEDEKKEDQAQKGQSKDDQKKEEQNKDEKESDQQEGDEKENEPQMAQNKPQQGKNDKQPAPEPTPGEKKEGELKANQEPQPASEGGQEQAEAEAEGEEKEGEMSAAQARRLLNSLRGEEERVRLMQRQQNEDTLKDW